LPFVNYNAVCYDEQVSERAIGGKDNMSRTLAAFTITILMLTAAVPLLSACHTVSGAGEDISATGQAIDRAAKKTTP
jgi:predicted small secreted protein